MFLSLKKGVSSNSITEKVRSCTSYDELPNRTIITTFRRVVKKCSYGIMLYSTSTDQWLLVRSKESYAFQQFMQGVYRMSQLKMLLDNMSAHELKTIRSLVMGQTAWEKIYRGNYLHATKERFYESIKALRYLLQSTKGVVSTHWSFPKGRLDHNEEPLVGAHREFEEETGINICKTTAIMHSSSPFTEVYTSFDGDTYETKCWFYTIDTPLTIPPVCDTNTEIADRQWVNTNTCRDLLSASKYHMIEQALSNFK